MIIKFLRKFFINILQWQAHLVLKRFKPKIIAITGSVGKTGTKDALFSVMKHFVHARKSDKSFNNEIGTPLTIIGVPTGWRNIFKWMQNVLIGFYVLMQKKSTYPEFLVLEVGVGKPGDMAVLRTWVKPDAVIVTAFGDMPPHVEFFDSPEGVWEEEASIIDSLSPGGLLILNADDPRVVALAHGKPVKVITFGFSESADVRLEHHQLMYNSEGVVYGVTFRISYQGKSLPIMVEGILGTSVAYYAGASFAMLSSLNINAVELLPAFTSLDVPRGRMRIISGIRQSVIIDDTYNSSPHAMTHALQTFQKIETKGKKIVVLGDMLELGKFSGEAHKQVGVDVAGIADILVTVGVRARDIAEGARHAGMSPDMITVTDDATQAGSVVKGMIESGDYVLVKGSQGVRCERVVGMIMEKPEEAENLLVRQDPEWLRK